jgi:hypothetical protein
MSSLRKKYRIESPDRDSPPVTTAPSGHGTEPYPTQVDTTPAPQDTPPQEAAPKPAESVEPGPSNAESPAEKAAKNALKARLAETQRAAEMEREAIAQQPRFAESQPHEPPTTEQIIEATQLPEKAKRWLREHPEYISDINKNQTIIALHDTAKRQAGSEWTDSYFERMEDLLGIKPAPPAPRNSEPVRRQQYSGPPVSAPISRDSPSLTTGRPTNEPTKLTGEEIALARSMGISPQEYAEGKKRMHREKAAGLHQNG